MLNQSDTFKELEIVCFNASSIVNKLDKLDHYLHYASNDFHTIFIAESWLHSVNLDIMICNHDFIAMRDDRSYGKGPGGGELLLYNNTLKITKFQPPIVDENTHFQFLSVDVHIKAHNTVRLFCFYIPPKSVANFSDFDVACQTLKRCRTTKYRHYICGDFNLPNIDWSASISKGGLSHDHFMEFCISFSICQHIMVPTHVDGNTLDLLLCDEFSDNSLVSFDVLPFLTPSHFSFLFVLLFPAIGTCQVFVKLIMILFCIS